ncbi:hypothetical protein EDC32_101265 [Laceyella sacchari]|uniref:hypothetical protein n=1 Tax=Laceyella sacchari TaxID=37482 RepID=UPI0010EB7F4A|nr:hypothetical protein [Laceyella sacchari]TCW40619.1 hypothetical protein EDC32_101265 [Laceyella sacchari]
MNHQSTNPEGTNISADVARIVETLQRLVQDTAKAEDVQQKLDEVVKSTQHLSAQVQKLSKESGDGLQQLTKLLGDVRAQISEQDKQLPEIMSKLSQAFISIGNSLAPKPGASGANASTAAKPTSGKKLSDYEAFFRGIGQCNSVEQITELMLQHLGNCEVDEVTKLVELQSKILTLKKTVEETNKAAVDTAKGQRDIQKTDVDIQKAHVDMDKAQKDMQKADHDMKYTTRNWMVALFTVLVALVTAINLIIYNHVTWPKVFGQKNP